MVSVLGVFNQKQKLKTPDKGVAKEKVNAKKHYTSTKSSSIEVTEPEVVRTFFNSQGDAGGEVFREISAGTDVPDCQVDNCQNPTSGCSGDLLAVPATDQYVGCRDCSAIHQL